MHNTVCNAKIFIKDKTLIELSHDLFNRLYVPSRLRQLLRMKVHFCYLVRAHTLYLFVFSFLLREVVENSGKVENKV